MVASKPIETLNDFRGLRPARTIRIEPFEVLKGEVDGHLIIHQYGGLDFPFQEFKKGERWVFFAVLHADDRLSLPICAPTTPTAIFRQWQYDTLNAPVCAEDDNGLRNPGVYMWEDARDSPPPWNCRLADN